MPRGTPTTCMCLSTLRLEKGHKTVAITSSALEPALPKNMGDSQYWYIEGRRNQGFWFDTARGAEKDCTTRRYVQAVVK